MTRRQRLLAAAAAAALAVAVGPVRPARAVLGVGDLVYDPAAVEQMMLEVENGLSQIRQLESIYTNARAQLQRLEAFYNLFAHVTDAAQLAEVLNSQFLQSPMLADALQLESTFRGLGLTTSLAGKVQGILGRIQYYRPSGDDFAGKQLNDAATATAGQMASAEDAYAAQVARVQGLKQLQAGIETDDPMRVAGIQARATIEAGVAIAQNNQLAAAGLLQNAQRDAAQQQLDQAWRYSVEQMRASAQAAVKAAQGGQVVLVTNAASPVGAPLRPDAAGGLNASGDGSSTSGSSSLPSTSGAGTGTMLAQSWGGQVAANAAAMGVSPEVMDAACVVESNCRNVVARAGSTVSGPFQMTDGTYNADIQKAIAQNPQLTSQVVGKNDPTTQGIAAAQELKNAAQQLQANGISNPTFLDTRGTYQFGAKYGAQIAAAPDTTLMGDILAGTSAATLAANAITPTTTVGQWRAAVSNKIGASANSPVLLGKA